MSCIVIVINNELASKNSEYIECTKKRFSVHYSVDHQREKKSGHATCLYTHNALENPGKNSSSQSYPILGRAAVNACFYFNVGLVGKGMSYHLFIVLFKTV